MLTEHCGVASNEVSELANAATKQVRKVLYHFSRRRFAAAFTDPRDCERSDLLRFYERLLYCTNRNVDMENAQQLRLLRSAEFSYTALDKYAELGSWNREKAKEDLKMLANKKVQGKVSLQVQVLFMITYD